MDIFSKIDDKSLNLENLSNTENQNTTSLPPKIGSTNIIDKNGKLCYKYVYDETKYDENYCRVYPPKPKYKGTDKAAQKRAIKLYQLLTAPFKHIENPQKLEKERQQRFEQIEKLLQNGINFLEYFSPQMNKQVLICADEQQLRLLFDYGFLLYQATISDKKEPAVFEKEIYYAFDNFDVFNLKHIPTEMLEKIIHTRKGIKISSWDREALLAEVYFNTPSRTAYNNIQLLIKTGQIYMGYHEVVALCANLEKANIEIIPEVKALREYSKQQIKISNQKYAEKRQIAIKTIEKAEKRDLKPEDKTTKTEAKDIIDKLFADAQKSID